MVFVQNERLWVRLHEKGGKHHTMPCQHNLEADLKAYLETSGRVGQPKLPLFPTLGRSSEQLRNAPLSRRNALHMVKLVPVRPASSRPSAMGLKTSLPALEEALARSEAATS